MSAAKEVATSKNLKASWVAAPVSKVLQTLQHMILMQDSGYAVLKQSMMTHISSAQESKRAKSLMKSHTAHYLTMQKLLNRIVATLLPHTIKRIAENSASMTLQNSASKRQFYKTPQKFNLT